MPSVDRWSGRGWSSLPADQLAMRVWSTDRPMDAWTLPTSKPVRREQSGPALKVDMTARRPRYPAMPPHLIAGQVRK